MADKTLQDVTDSLKAVENAIKNPPEAESVDVTAAIKGVEDSVKAVGETIKNPPKSAADVERAAEAAQSASVERSIFQGIYDTLNKGFGAATGKDKKSGGLIAGLLGGIGAGLGGIGKAVASIGKGFGIGLAALGAGIAGFALALGGASMILGLMGTDGSALTAIITNFFDAFTTENAAKMGVILVIAGLLAGFKVSPIRFAGMMTAMGAGIAGFAGGILLGEVVTGYGLKLMGGLDGSSIAKIINNFFGALTPESTAGLGVVVTIAGLLAAFKVDATAFAKQMTGVGAGIAGFAAGLLIGDAGTKLAAMAGLDGGSISTLINSFFGSMTPASTAGLGVVVTIAGLLAAFKVDATAFAKQMTGVGAGIAGFAGGLLIGDAAAKLGEMAGLDGKSITTLMTNFFGAMTPTVAGGLGVIVTIAGLLAAFKVKPKDFALAMTGVGAGISGFAAGILLGDAAASYTGLDGSALIGLLQNFFGAMTPEIAAGMGVIVTLAGLAAKLKISAAQMILGMTGIGAGISGFSLGILLGDGAAKLGAMAGLDGSSLKTLISNFMGAFEGVGMKPLAGLIIAGSVLGAFGPAGATAAIIGMGAIGAGIAAFMVGLLAADWIASLGGDSAGASLAVLLTNVGKAIGGFLGGFAGETMEQMKSIDADKLAKIGKGILDLGLGMVAFAGGRAAGGLADMVGGIGNAIGSLFGGEDKGPLHIFAAISKDTSIDANRLAALGGGISDLATGLETFAKIDTAGLTNNMTQLEKMSGKGFFESIGERVKDAGSYVAEKTGQLKEAVVSTAKSAMESDAGKSLKTKGAEVTKTAKNMVKQDVGSTEGKKEFAVMASQSSQPKDLTMHKGEKGKWNQVGNEWVFYSDRTLATGGLITPKTAGIFQLHQGEMVLDNAAVAAFTKSLNLVNMSQSNALAGVGGGGTPIIVNNNNVDNSMQSSQTTAVSIPEPTRTNESTVRALQMN